MALKLALGKHYENRAEEAITITKVYEEVPKFPFEDNYGRRYAPDGSYLHGTAHVYDLVAEVSLAKSYVGGKPPVIPITHKQQWVLDNIVSHLFSLHGGESPAPITTLDWCIEDLEMIYDRILDKSSEVKK